MPRKLKVENLSELPESEDMQVAAEAAPEVAPTEEVISPVVEAVPEPVDEVPNAKPKAKSKAKAKAAPVEDVKPEPVEPVEDVKPEPVVAEIEHAPAKKKEDKVTCPDCGRLVSAKTLKYTHKANCKSLKPKHPEEAHSAVCYQKEDKVEQPAQAAEPTPIKEQPTLLEQYEESIEDRMRKVRMLKMQKKQERISNLAAQAF